MFLDSLKTDIQAEKLSDNEPGKESDDMKEWDSVMIWLFNKSLSYLLILSYLEGHSLSGR